MFSDSSPDKLSSHRVIRNYRHISQNWYTWMTETSWTCDSHIGGGTLQVCWCMSRTLSFVAGRQVSSLGENGADGERGGFLCAWVRPNIVSCTCAAKFFGPSAARTRQWGTASSRGIKNSGVTGRACASQNAQDDRAVRRRVKPLREGGLSTQPPEDHWQSKSESWVSHSLPCGEFFANACGWSHTSYSYCRL